MKTNIILRHDSSKLKPVTIQEFAEEHDLIMELREMDNGDFTASFESAEVREGVSMLVGSYGYAAKQEDAIRDYARRISGKLLVVDAMGPARREIQVPILK